MHNNNKYTKINRFNYASNTSHKKFKFLYNCEKLYKIWE